jgi:uncharacterized protein involved in exopolysaccharide biosynthesis
LQTEVEVIKSDTVLFQAAQSINLDQPGSPEFGKNGLKQHLLRPSRPGAPRDGRNHEGRIVHSIVPDTRILEIHYRGTDPKLAAEIVNGLVDTYSDEGLRVSFERTAHVSDWLEKQLDT